MKKISRPMKKIRSHKAPPGRQLISLGLPPFCRTASPNQGFVLREWRVENLGRGDVALFAYSPGNARPFFCKLAADGAVEFQAGGVIFESLDHFGASLILTL